MNQYSLKWPDNFDDYAWEVESKGWFPGLEIQVDGKTFRPVFYEPVRLAQDIAEDIARGGYFSESRLIVVSKVTREMMERTIDELAKTGELDRLG